MTRASLGYMVRSHLTLAALATSAVANLEVTQVREHTFGGEGDYTSAVLRVADGEELIIRIPNSTTAETRQSADLLGLAALTEGARSRLPFAVSEALGQTRAKNTRAVVYRYLDGYKVDESQITADSTLVPSIASTLAAIHRLPSGLIVDAGLPVRSAAEVREETSRLLARAESTRLVPSSVLTRWNRVMHDTKLWQFNTTVVNGGLSADSLLLNADGEVAAVLDWSELRVSDPAVDFSWLTNAPADTLLTTVADYARLRDLPDPANLLRRAEFYHELELAKWLLHGKDTHDQSIVDDAIGMFATLVDRISGDDSREDAAPAMSITQVQDLLEHVPADVSLRVEADADGILDDSELESRAELDGDADEDFGDESSAGDK